MLFNIWHQHFTLGQNWQNYLYFMGLSFNGLVLFGFGFCSNPECPGRYGSSDTSNSSNRLKNNKHTYKHSSFRDTDIEDDTDLPRACKFLLPSWFLSSLLLSYSSWCHISAGPRTAPWSWKDLGDRVRTRSPPAPCSFWGRQQNSLALSMTR